MTLAQAEMEIQEDWLLRPLPADMSSPARFVDRQANPMTDFACGFINSGFVEPDEPLPQDEPSEGADALLAVVVAG